MLDRMQERTASWSPMVRVLVAAAIGFLAWWPMIGLTIVAFAVGSGCFMECADTARPWIGLPLLVIPAGMTAAWGALAAWAVGRPDAARRTAKILFGLWFLWGAGLTLVNI